MSTLLLRNARLADNSTVDVLIVDDTVVDVGSRIRESAGTRADVIDLEGFLLLAAPVEPHAHLDKALTGDLVVPVYGDLSSAARAWKNHAESLTTENILDRGRDALRELLWSGATAVRTHVNKLPGRDPLLALRALVRLREAAAEVMSVQIVYVSSKTSTTEELRSAVAAGADALGGAPHTAQQPTDAQAAVLAVAAQTGVDVDLHTNEDLDTSTRTLVTLAEQVSSSGFTGRVTASHCVSLGMQDPVERGATIAAVKSAGIAVVALPSTNLYLQGRAASLSPPRGMPPLRELLNAGVPVAGGGDNFRDPFLPVGRADPFETASLLVTAGHLTVEEAYAAISETARQIMGLPPAGPTAGLRADILAVRATSLTDAIARAPQDRLVISRGQIAARSTVKRETHLLSR